MQFTIEDLARNVLTHLKERIVQASKNGFWSFNEDYIAPPHIVALRAMGVEVTERAIPGKNRFFTISW